MNRPTADGAPKPLMHAKKPVVSVSVPKPVGAWVTVKLKYSVKRAHLLGRTKNKMDYKNLDDVHETYKTSDSGISPTAGVGLEHEINENWSVRAGWDHYFNVGKGDQLLHLDENKNYNDLRSVKTDTDLLYVGATFNF